MERRVSIAPLSFAFYFLFGTVAARHLYQLILSQKLGAVAQQKNEGLCEARLYYEKKLKCSWISPVLCPHLSRCISPLFIFHPLSFHLFVPPLLCILLNLFLHLSPSLSLLHL